MQPEYTRTFACGQYTNIEKSSVIWYILPMPKTKNNQKEAEVDEYLEQLVARTDDLNQARPSDEWMEGGYGGQLAVDVYQTPSSIVIRSAIAGVNAQDIDITVNNDMVTIKGVRRTQDEVPASDFLYQECYWGGFSRTIILPVDVDADRVSAAIKNGILRVVLPKNERPDSAVINVIEEDEAE